MRSIDSFVDCVSTTNTHGWSYSPSYYQESLRHFTDSGAISLADNNNRRINELEIRLAEFTEKLDRLLDAFDEHVQADLARGLMNILEEKKG